MKENRKDDENPIVIYTSQDGQVHVNVRIEGETAWLTQAAMTQLFGCGSDNIVKHLKNIYDEGELKDSARGCRRNGGASIGRIPWTVTRGRTEGQFGRAGTRHFGARER